jgi:hypothetical protein
MAEDLLQSRASTGVDDCTGRAAVPLLFPKMVHHVGHHHLVPNVPGLGQLFNPRVKLRVRLRVLPLINEGVQNSGRRRSEKLKDLERDILPPFYSLSLS